MGFFLRRASRSAGSMGAIFAARLATSSSPSVIWVGLNWAIDIFCPVMRHRLAIYSVFGRRRTSVQHMALPGQGTALGTSGLVQPGDGCGPPQGSTRG